MRDIGLYIMAQNDADLLTDNLQPLRGGLTCSNDDSATDLARGLRHGLQKVGALLSSALGGRDLEGFLISGPFPLIFLPKAAHLGHAGEGICWRIPSLKSHGGVWAVN